MECERTRWSHITPVIRRDVMNRMAEPDDITIRVWRAGDREAVEGLLKLLSEDAVLAAGDAPVYLADTGDRVIGMVTLCVFRTLTGPKGFLDHLVVDPGFRRRGIGR